MASEKEKMLPGRPCRAFKDELERERQSAGVLIHQYNHLYPCRIVRKITEEDRKYDYKTLKFDES